MSFTNNHNWTEEQFKEFFTTNEAKQFDRAKGRLYPDEQAAEDVMQEAKRNFVKWVTSKTSEPVRNPPAFFGRIVTNACNKLLRQRWREQKKTNSTDCHIFLYYFLDGLSWAEISHILGISVKTVNRRYQAFIDWLRCKYEKED